MTRRLSLFLLLLPALVLLAAILIQAGGLTYTLDDPYIHLRMAENLGRHGHYGINPGELSAPASSILWPFLLVPATWMGALADWLPLLLTSLALVLTLDVLLRWLRALFTPARAMLLALLLALALNFYGLAFTGMEHSLQVLLALLVAIAVATPGSPLARWLHPALILLPLVRYDSLAVTVPALLWLGWRGDWRVALRSGLLSLLLPLLFSLWLQSQDLGWLPSSVRLKSDFMNPNNPLWQTLAYKAWVNTPFEFGMLSLLLLSLWLAERQRWPGRHRLWLGLLACALHFFFGLSNQQSRYEVHVHTFALVMLLATWSEARPRAPRLELGGLIVLILASHVWQLRCTLLAPLAAHNINAQQGQLARLTRDFLREPVAVNDIGLMSWRSSLPVLDLVGLGSPEVVRLRYRYPEGTPWVGELMRRHDVHHAFIYDDWFPDRPAHFIPVARLVFAGDPIGPARNTVSLYADSPAAATRLRLAVTRFQQAVGNDNGFMLTQHAYQADTH